MDKNNILHFLIYTFDRYSFSTTYTYTAGSTVITFLIYMLFLPYVK